MFYILIVVVLSQIYACVKTQRTIYPSSKINIKIKQCFFKKPQKQTHSSIKLSKFRKRKVVSLIQIKILLTLYVQGTGLGRKETEPSDRALALSSARVKIEALVSPI